MQFEVPVILAGAFVAAFAVGAVAPAIWSGLRGWPMDRQRGAFQTFGLAIDVVALASTSGCSAARCSGFCWYPGF